MVTVVIYVLLTLALIVGTLFLLISIIRALFLDIYVPFVPTKRRIIAAIVGALDVCAGDVVYDLGAGDGRILFACFEADPNARYVGIEQRLFPFLFSRVRYALNGHPKNISFRRGDIRSTNLQDATHIYTFLNNAMMREIRSRIPASSHVVSCAFPFPDLTPEKTIEITSVSPRSLFRRLYVYTF